MINSIALERRLTGLFLRGEWPLHTAFSAKVLAIADPRFMRVEGDVVTLTVANGSARYRLEAVPGDPKADPLEIVPIPATRVDEEGRRMSAVDGRVLEISEVQSMSTPELIDAGLDWVGQIRVEPNTWSMVCKQALCDILVALKHRETHGPA